MEEINIVEGTRDRGIGILEQIESRYLSTKSAVVTK
jgi:hypothetical protein